MQVRSVLSSQNIGSCRWCTSLRNLDIQGCASDTAAEDRQGHWTPDPAVESLNMPICITI